MINKYKVLDLKINDGFINLSFTKDKGTMYKDYLLDESLYKNFSIKEIQGLNHIILQDEGKFFVVITKEENLDYDFKEIFKKNVEEMVGYFCKEEQLNIFKYKLVSYLSNRSKQVKNINLAIQELKSPNYNINSTEKDTPTSPYSNIYKNLSEQNPISVKGISALILESYKMRASDIHLEPYKKFVRVRFRLDGVLKTITNIDNTIYSAIISRLKILSKLNIVETRLPQDGKFKYDIEGKDIDFRVSIIPTIYGEKAVVRILNEDINNFNLGDLKLNEKNYEIFMRGISKKNGIILTGGPTSAGKTSTLYSILKYKNEEEVNIITAEDPVEYELEGINQVQCRPEIGLDFSNLLRSFLRQDPEILMVGEIRDGETAEIAIKAALTGHLVFSTIHVNDSVGAIDRLLNLGIDPYLISSALVMVVSQRLVRLLCDECKVEDEAYLMNLKILNIKENLTDNKFYRHFGCENCLYTGYKGRIPIFEIFYIDDEIREMILKKRSTKEIYEKAKENGMESLLEDAISKAIDGKTSLEEILRQL